MSAVQCARARGGAPCRKWAHPAFIHLPPSAAGVPLLRCAARRRVRIGCAVSLVPLRRIAGAPLAAVLCILAPRIFVAGSGRAVVAVCAQTRQLRVPPPPCVRCSSRRLCHWFCPAGSPPYALYALKWAFWRVWRGVGVCIAMSRGRAIWLHCVPAARPAGARLRARGVPVVKESAARRDRQRRQLCPTCPQVPAAGTEIQPSTVIFPCIFRCCRADREGSVHQMRAILSVNGEFLGFIAAFQIAPHKIGHILRYAHLARASSSSD